MILQAGCRRHRNFDMAVNSAPHFSRKFARRCPTHKRRFDPTAGPRCTGAKSVVELITAAPRPVSPEVHHEGVTCVVKAKTVRDSGRQHLR